MTTSVPIIDIFAGPGGLGEGFSAFVSEDKISPFKIKISIEMDEFAHQTLVLRAFFRQFSKSETPEEYYSYIRGEINREDLFKKYPNQYENAKMEAWRIELKTGNRKKVKKRVGKVLDNADRWVLIGGPPCQAYSLVGRSRMIGGNKRKYVRDRRHVLYKEYLQILADLQPPVFVMENVKGLLSSKLKKQSTFDLIIADLKNPLGVTRLGTSAPLGYDLFSLSTDKKPDQELEPEDFIVRSEKYGIPQARHRVFIFGVRSDLTHANIPTLEKVEQDKRAFIEHVISDLPPLRSGLSKGLDTPEKWQSAIQSIKSASWLEATLPDMRDALINELENIRPDMHRGADFLTIPVLPTMHDTWYMDPNLHGVCNHETRGHIVEDLHRYFFASVFSKVNGRSPTLADFPQALLPNHKNIKKALSSSMFNDRFRVQVQGRPSTTIVSHISKDGHYYIHYDPAQCRSLTVREAARLQTFPDNYFFEGTRTQQYHQVGNAVPPLLARQIAAIVYQVLESI